eukprot:TRINITY_DN7719_c0_g2_i1.p1 TRINITY_DN7719_c0_g2~~TRINITY_DN7719_c0_g2_i1.p1  ORF type:complete len:450 (+),score=133.79 TRINITY_DN7719_c0_g2_i1:261-1610(+)
MLIVDQAWLERRRACHGQLPRAAAKGGRRMLPGELPAAQLEAPRGGAIRLRCGATVAATLAAAREARLGVCCPLDEVAHELARRAALQDVRNGFWTRVRDDASGFIYARAAKCLNRYVMDRDAGQLRLELEKAGLSGGALTAVVEWTVAAVAAADQKTADLGTPLSEEDIEVGAHPKDNAAMQFKVSGKPVAALEKPVYAKLVERYTGPEEERDAAVLWVALRYDRLTAGRSGLQDAIPPPVMDVLARRLAVSGEIFASPLNCLSPVFCSLYPDSDCVFGSVGDAFRFAPTEGSFEANPPFTESLLTKMAAHFLALLDASEARREKQAAAEGGDEGDGARPLAFTIIIPEWTDPIPAAVEAVRASRHLRADFTVPKAEHAYCDGLTGGPTPPFLRNTLVLVLMNSGAAAVWGGTARLEAFRAELVEVWAAVPQLEQGGGGRPLKRRRVA